MKNQLERIASEKNEPCVSISLNTHRTHPDNLADEIELKKLLKEAEERIIEGYGKRPVKELLDKIETIGTEIDSSHNLDSLHIFLSDTTTEIIKSPWPVSENVVHISNTFSIKPIIKLFNRTENYLILLLSNNGVKLLHAINDSIIEEVENDDFPYSKNLLNTTNQDKVNEGSQADNTIREFLNVVDKAVVKVNNETNMHCVVVCTEENYSHLMQVADKPSVYYGFVHITNTEVANNTLAAETWNIVHDLQQQSRKDAIEEMQEAQGQGKIITDLSEIYKAAKEGRGDLLITHDNFHQPVKMTGEYSFDLVVDATETDVIDDISSEIAWEVISKKGRAIFTSSEEFDFKNDIALKVRY